VGNAIFPSFTLTLATACFKSSTLISSHAPCLLIIVVLRTLSAGPVPDDPICGRPAIPPSVTAMNRIIGGEVARAHSWPWQCSIRYKYTTPPWGQFCGASVLTRRHVVTAAHCMLVTILTNIVNKGIDLFQQVGRPYITHSHTLS